MTDALKLGLRLRQEPIEEDGQHAILAEPLQKGRDLHGVAAIIDQRRIFGGCFVDRAANRALGPAMNIVRHQSIDRVPHDINIFCVWQILREPGQGIGKIGQFGIMRARFAAQIAVARLGEKIAIPVQPLRPLISVAEEIRLLGRGHEEAGLRRQLHVQRAGRALHRTNDHEIGKTRPAHPRISRTLYMSPPGP